MGNSRESPQPRALEEMLQLGMRHHRAGRLAEAKGVYEQILKSDPSHPEALRLLGLLAERAGQFRAAEQLFRRSLAAQTCQSSVWQNLAHLLGKQRRFQEAECCAREAVTLEPTSASAHRLLGFSLRFQGRAEDSLAAYQTAFQLDPDSAAACSNLAALQFETGNVQEAVSLWRRSIELKPDLLESHYNLGNAYKSLGDPQKAASSYEQALSIKPGQAEIHRVLTTVKQFAEKDEQVAAMEQLYRRPDLADADRMHLGFALGTVYDQLQDHENAFVCFEAGNRLKRQTLQFELPEVAATFAQIKARFTASLLDRTRGNCRDESCIFIVGLPRSGTSLVEQMLASHPDVHGAGELETLRQIAVQDTRKMTGRDYPRGVQNLNPSNLTTLGQAYLKRLPARAAGVRRVTDKMPRNFELVGLIKLLLPEAKVIHCRRSGIDTCWSIFKSYLPSSNGFAFDLRELGEYYLLYEDLMQWWSQVLPSFICELEYEQLVSHPREQVQRILDFCGLAWHDRCLDFHRTDRPVNTASAVQVRQPLYTTSVGAWRPYARQLAPLIEVLARAGKAT